MRSFTLLTMGLNLILLGLFAKANERIQTFFYPLVVFGQAPLFFYIVHLFLYAGLVCGWRRRAPASRPCIHTGCWACYCSSLFA